MLFNSQIFLFLFLPVTAACFIFLARKGWLQSALVWAIASSLFFYGWWNPPYLLVIVASIILNYIVGCSIADFRGRKISTCILVAGVSSNLFALAYFKYSNFFMANVAYLLQRGYNAEQIILPLAISFFTFQQIAFLVDTYREKKQFPDLVSYSFFVSFFPQLIAGPIARHHEIIPQIKQTLLNKINKESLAIGLSIFSIGLFKKVVIADRISGVIDPIYESSKYAGSVQLWEGWTAALGYYFQIYFDFSAYSDMAVGLGLIFGIRLPQNFNSPYKAKSIIEFWRCWHMTLSRFLRDYLYIPLGGSRRGYYKYYRNLGIVMLLGGLWHGAAWGFILWGAVHGTLLIVNHLWKRFFNSGSSFFASRFWIAIAWIMTTCCIVFAWILFRAESLSSASEIYRAIAGMNGLGSLAEHSKFFALLAILWFWVLTLPNTLELFRKKLAREEFGIDYTTGIFSAINVVWIPTKTWAVFCALLFFWSAINVGGVSEFIYFQF